MLRSLRTFTEILAALVGVTIICALLLAWRLSSSPVSPDFLTPYIKTGIESLLPGSKVQIDSLLMTWDRPSHSFVFHAKNVKINNANDDTIADIPVFDAKVSMLGLLFGQIIPTKLSIDQPQIKLDRDKNGILTFNGRAIGTAEPQTPSEPIDKTIESAAERLSGAAFTQKLAMTHAVFGIHDEKLQKDWLLSVPELSVTRNGLKNFNRSLRYGALSGRMTIELPKARDSSLAITYEYDPSIRQHKLTSAFEKITPALVAGENPAAFGLTASSVIDLPLTGRAELIFDESLKLVKIAAQIHGDEGRLVSPDFWDSPCPVKGLDLNVKYNRVTRKLTVSDTRIDFNGPTLDIKIDGTPSSEQGRDLDFTAELKVEKLPMNRYGEIWPKPVLPNPRYWLTANLHDGTFDRADVTLKGSAAFNDLANPFIAEGGGTIAASGGKVIYLDGMPAAENVGAEATFDLKKMDVKITGGGIGNIRILPFDLRITGLAEIDQYIDLPLKISGPLQEIMQLLDHPPLMYAKALGVSPKDMSGKIEGTVVFRFPLLKTLEMKDMELHAVANATDVASSKLIPGVPIDQGDLALDLNMSGFNLKGKASLGKSPFRVFWEEKFEQKANIPLRQIKAVGTVRDDKWNNFGIAAFNGTKGPIKVSLDVIKHTKNKMTYAGALDMTSADLVISQINWKKPANNAAVLKFSAESLSGKPITVSPIVLEGKGVAASGSAVLSEDMEQLLSLDFSPLTVGRTNAAIKYVQESDDKGLQFEAKGAALDLSGLSSGDSDGKASQPKKISIEVDRLYTAEDGLIDKVKLSALRDKTSWKEISFQGKADGDAPLNIELSPKADGTRTFKFVCGNFGKAMKGLGFTNTIKDGKIYVVGQSSPEEPATIKGNAKINNFTVSKLPILALLLNATSPFGFTGLLTDTAEFNHFDGAFIWKGDEISITSAHVSGPSVGINIDGKVDMATSNANLQGTLVPFSTVNSILNSIPLIGDLITGGKDQGVLAVSYEINGNINKPKVSVNPVSLLTPGFIRNLFFSDNEEEEEEQEPEQEQKQEQNQKE
ncbi:MAG: AsmA-like C-terminal domain-containing protein [Bdellovibrionales bacterium]